MINCIIVEDEKSAQDVLLTYIAKTPFLECVKLYESGLDIDVKTIDSVEFMFLDIELPEINGISFLRTLKKKPKVIVTTAYSHYAVSAFEEHVMDYLVKPFSYERFFKAVSRVKYQLQLEKNEVSDEVFLYSDKTFHKVKVNEILYIKAEVDYVKVVTRNKSVLVLDSLRNWEEKLSVYEFIRIHRSYLVNKKALSSFNSSKVTIDDKVLPVGKVFSQSFLRSMKVD